MKALDLVRLHKIHYEFWVIKYAKDLPRLFLHVSYFSGEHFNNENKQKIFETTNKIDSYNNSRHFTRIDSLFRA